MISEWRQSDGEINNINWRRLTITNAAHTLCNMRSCTRIANLAIVKEDGPWFCGAAIMGIRGWSGV